MIITSTSSSDNSLDKVLTYFTKYKIISSPPYSPLPLSLPLYLRVRLVQSDNGHINLYLQLDVFMGC